MSEAPQLNIKSLGGDAASGVKVFFIHGFGADKQSWAGNAPAVFDFAESLALDLPGHGESVDVEGWHGLQSVAELIMRQLSDYQAVHLVGHSVGASLAVLIAANQPASVKSLSLLAPVGLGQGVSRRFTDTLINLENESEAFELLLTLVFNKRLIARPLAGLLLSLLDRPGARASLKTFATALHDSKDELRAAFAKIDSSTVPRQVFWGKQDEINLLHAEDAIAFGGDWHYLNNCGHLAHVEQRAFFNTKLCEFLKNCEDL